MKKPRFPPSQPVPPPTPFDPSPDELIRQVNALTEAINGPNAGLDVDDLSAKRDRLLKQLNGGSR